MIIPIRCFSCGKPIAQVWDEYIDKIAAGKKPEDALNELGIERYCCRRMIVSHKDYLKELIKYHR